MSQSISYSINRPDERSPRDMHAYMRGLSQDAENFYDNEKAVIKWTLQTYWDTLCREMNLDEWIGISTPQVVNAFNLLSKNSVSENKQ
jgi:predicted metalloendopeptidase